MSSDLIFFTGFEGEIPGENATIFHNTGESYNGLYVGGGFLGKRGVSGYRYHGRSTGWGEINLPENLAEIYVGFHTVMHEPDTRFFELHMNNNNTINFSYTTVSKLVVTGFGSEFIYDAFVTQNVFFHIDIYCNAINGNIRIKINGIEVLNVNGVNVGGTFSKTHFRRNGFSNIWIHKTKSLGQAITFFSKPTADGHYAPNAGLFQTNDGSPEGWAKLQENDGDDNYIYSSVPDAKFTCKQELLPIGYHPVAFCIQSIYKNVTGGGLLYVRDLLRYNSLQEDFLGEIRAVPSIYTHSTLFRTNYDKAPDGTELTRDKINDMEIGSQLIELEE